MTKVILAAALLVATLAPAQAYWVYRTTTVRLWHPDPPRYLTRGEELNQLCLERATRGLDAGHFREAELICALRHPVRERR